MNEQIFTATRTNETPAVVNFQITLFGDSVSKGLYLQNKKIMRIGHSAVDILAQNYGMAVDNLSFFGQTLKKCWEKGHFERFAEENKRGGRTAVIALGGNDCDYNWEEVAAAPYAEHRPNTPLPEFEEILGRVISTLKGRGHTPVFASLPPIDSLRYFENVICGRADGARVMEFFCGDVTNISRHQEAYNAAIMRKALSEGCGFIDFRSELLLKRGFLNYLSDDGIHPNQKGHEAIAAAVGKYISAARKSAFRAI